MFAAFHNNRWHQADMFDSNLRALKDRIFDPISRLVPHSITPLFITGLAFICGLTCCACVAYDNLLGSEVFWFLNRALDCLDGAVARQRKQSSDLGGFLDLLCDFTIYSLIPICCGLSESAQRESSRTLWLSVAVVEASFHVNNFILFYAAAIVEKQKASAKSTTNLGDSANLKHKKASESEVELTSVTMKATLIEGTESAILFTIMIAMPAWLEYLCWWMAAFVGIGILDRTIYLTLSLRNQST